MTRRRGPGSRPGAQTSGMVGEARGDARGTQVSTQGGAASGEPGDDAPSASDSEARPCPTRERRGGSPHATAVARARWTASADRRASCLTVPSHEGLARQGGTDERSEQQQPRTSLPSGRGRRGARQGACRTSGRRRSTARVGPEEAEQLASSPRHGHGTHHARRGRAWHGPGAAPFGGRGGGDRLGAPGEGSPGEQRAWPRRQRGGHVTASHVEQGLEVDRVRNPGTARGQRRAATRARLRRRSKALKGEAPAGTPRPPTTARWHGGGCNPVNPRVGCRMQQACEPPEEKTARVGRNHEGGPSRAVGTVRPKRAARRVGEDSGGDVDGGAIFGQPYGRRSARAGRRERRLRQRSAQGRTGNGTSVTAARPRSRTPNGEPATQPATPRELGEGRTSRADRGTTGSAHTRAAARP